MKKLLLGLAIPIILALLMAGSSSYSDTRANTIKNIDQDKRLDKVERKIDEVHWFLIKRNNVKVPKGI